MKLVPLAVYLLIVTSNRYGVSAAESTEVFNDYEGWANEAWLPEDRNSDYYVNPYWLKVIWWTLFITTDVIVCIGNTAVVLAEFRNSICKAGLRYLLVQMCISDAIAPIIFRFPLFVQKISVNWPFGPVFCGIMLISSTPIIITNYVSIAALALERFLCFIRPGKLPMTRKFAWKIIGATWIVSILLCLPHILTHHTSDFFHLGSYTTICHYRWGRELDWTNGVRLLSGLVFETIFKPVPVILIGYVYLRIALPKWCHRSSEQGHHFVLPCIQENRKIFCLTDVLVFGFAACDFLPWLPFQFQIYLHDTFNSHVNVWLILWWLTSCRAIICPIIYFNFYKRNSDEPQQEIRSRSEMDSGCSHVQLRNVDEGCSTSTI